MQPGHTRKPPPVAPRYIQFENVVLHLFVYPMLCGQSLLIIVGSLQIQNGYGADSGHTKSSTLAPLSCKRWQHYYQIIFHLCYFGKKAMSLNEPQV